MSAAGNSLSTGIETALAKFLQWAMNEGPWQGNDLDGGSVQNMAQHHGLIEEVTYDPATHGENVYDVCKGEPWFVLAPAVLAAISGIAQAAQVPKPMTADERWCAANGISHDDPTMQRARAAPPDYNAMANGPPGVLRDLAIEVMSQQTGSRRLMAMCEAAIAAIQARPRDVAYPAWMPIDENTPRNWLSPILAWNSRQPTWPPVTVRWNKNEDGLLDGDPHWSDAATASGDALYFNQNFFDLWMPCPNTSLSSTQLGCGDPNCKDPNCEYGK